MAKKIYILAVTTKVGGSFLKAGEEIELEPTAKETKAMLDKGILVQEKVIVKTDDTSKKVLEEANDKIVGLEAKIAELEAKIAELTAEIVVLKDPKDKEIL